MGALANSDDRDAAGSTLFTFKDKLNHQRKKYKIMKI